MNGENVKLESVPSAYTSCARRRRLIGKEQFLLTLTRLRRGFSTQRLEWLLEFTKVQSAEYSSVGWTSFTFVCQQFQFGQQENKSIKPYMPHTFKNCYPKTRVIIDCTEFYCEAPTSLELKGNMYSDYKGRETYKALVGITPQWMCFFCFPPLSWEFIWPRDSGKKWSSQPKHVWWWWWNNGR